MKYFSTFSGVGGFELGLQGHDCVGFSEIDKYASAVLKHKFPNIKNYGDIKKIDWKSVPDFDLLVGGSPCQDLSVAGKRAGLTGERSGLFAEYIRAVKEKKPSYFIWENVKGALSAEVQAEMEQQGYSLWWQILNAKDYGIPQNRERVFVVGFRNECPPKVFFERGANKETVVANTIRTGGKGSLSKKHAWDLIEITKGKSQGNRVYDPNGISTTIASQAGGMGAKTGLYAIPVLTPDRPNKRQNGRRFKEDGEPSFTLTGQDRHGVYNGKTVRRLTPRECERLMSWSDDWTKLGNFDGEVKEISDTQRYKMCGNGVVSKIVALIEDSIL